MTFRPLIFLTAAAAFALAEAPVPQPHPELPPPLQIPTGQPWLGLQIAKTDPSISAHIPSLPPGIGFVVKSIDAGGPAETAKLVPFDILWKLGDQMLVNEAQLATLLRLSKPGDEVTLSIFRGGQALDISLKLGDLPAGKNSFNTELAETAILPNDSGPIRMVNVAERTASFATAEGKAVLRRDGEAYLVTIRSPEDRVIFEGEVTTKENFKAVPEEWRRRVYSLRRGLDHATEGKIVPVRPPRPRVVPAPAPTPAPTR